jgi:hypothetical protein
MTDIPFEMGTADAWIYHKVSEEIANSMRNGDFNLRLALDKAMGSHVSFSDSGYPIYLSFIYSFKSRGVVLALLRGLTPTIFRFQLLFLPQFFQ